MTDVLIKRELLEQVASEFEHDNDRYMLGRELRKVLDAPRQPEGEIKPDITTKHGYPAYSVEQHQRAIAELRDRLDVMTQCADNYSRMFEESAEECEHLKACQENDMLHMTGLVAERDTLRQQLAELREECERLRMQLAACGVVALANTPESASEARQMHPDYMSASCSDVADAVDREITLRQQLAERDAEVLEQCRLNGMGAERELKLIAQRDKLAGLLQKARWYVASARYSDNDEGDFAAHRQAVMLTDIDAALAEVKPCPESLHPAAT